MIERLKDHSGYSLVEVLAAIVILSIAILPMVGMFDSALKAAVLGGNYDTARATASQELEEIKALPYEDAVADYPPGGSTPCSPPLPSVVSDCQVKTTYVVLGASGITADSDARSMMRVEVTVEWDGDSNSYTTTGLISKETA